MGEKVHRIKRRRNTKNVEEIDVDSTRIAHREVHMFDIVDQAFVPGLGDASPQLLHEVLEAQLLVVVEGAQLLPDLLGGVVEGAHTIKKVHRVGEVVPLGASLGGVLAGPHLAPARRQIAPGIVAQLHLHRLQHVGELHRQCAQLISTEEGRREFVHRKKTRLRS